MMTIKRYEGYKDKSKLAEEITYLGSKVDSGRHTGADVQRLRRKVAEYEEIERSAWKDHSHHYGPFLDGGPFEVGEPISGDTVTHVHVTPYGPTSPPELNSDGSHRHSTIVGPTGPNFEYKHEENEDEN